MTSKSADSASHLSPDNCVLPEPQAWRALIALCIGFFMILLDQTIVAVATPKIEADLQASINQVFWITSIYLLCIVVPLLFTGRLGDRYGQRNLYRIGMSIFVLSSAACGFANHVETLVIARGVQGIGAAILIPQTMSVINRIFAPSRRGAALGLWGAVGGLAGVVSPLLGGVLVGGPGWEWIFFINIPLGVLSLIMVTLWVPTMPRHARTIDIPSVVVSLCAMSLIVYSILNGPQMGWSIRLVVMIIIGLGGVVWFIRLQQTASSRGTEALVPLEIFHNRNFSIASFSISTMGFTVASMMLPIMFHLQDGLGFTPQKSGLVMAPMAAITVIGSPIVGRLSDHCHPRNLSMVGFGLTAFSLAWIGISILRDAGLWWFLAGVCLMGVGTCFSWSPNSAAAMRTMNPRFMGAASGVYNTTRQTGSVLGSAAVGAAMQMAFAHQSGVSGSAGIALLLPAAALACGFIAVSFFEADKISE
ncbi:DHA2 family efflux MFS transporter permease subunit [Corynebacterium sp. 3HC-13]|uniref:DHA2 family efflux MFS transporter permease subunit n=1 Tax=Corynebacterium poyangense TaxID=2684405 RepID=UPI001CCA9AAE|nr:DHA2 family efflux MFS transporter permease subunit [Corynebacterium poyangense]MBZ8177115.1 DHA2 family efflux MFS transporter permease subunit [Corynebacterium poyangense]